MSVGERIKIARQSSRKTKTEVAKALGVSRETVARWESGKHEIPVSMLVGIAKFLGVKASSLIGE